MAIFRNSKVIQVPIHNYKYVYIYIFLKFNIIPWEIIDNSCYGIDKQSGPIYLFIVPIFQTYINYESFKQIEYKHIGDGLCMYEKGSDKIEYYVSSEFSFA